MRIFLFSLAITFLSITTHISGPQSGATFCAKMERQRLHKKARSFVGPLDVIVS